MKYNPEIHNRRSIRLKEYDYSQEGAYYVTICAWGKEHLFGNIVNRDIELSSSGDIAFQCWMGIPNHFSNVELDEIIVMPNHVHGIIVINNDCRGWVSPPISETNKSKTNKSKQKGGETQPLRKRTLGQIIGYFKYQTTKQINNIRNTPGMPVWQRNYYEHVIRNEYELNRIREYIINNPVKWDEDEYNPNLL